MGRFNTMIVTTTVSAIVVLALWLPSKGNIPAIIFSVVYGFSSGAFVALTPTLIAQISPIREIGVRNGTCFFIASFAGLVGNPIAGALVSAQDGGFIGLQIFCGVCMFAGTGFYVVARWWQAGFKAKII
jgi:MFS family permease